MLWFDAGVEQSLAFRARVSAVAKTMPGNATCHSCGMLDMAIPAVSWMGNEAGNMPYPNWGASSTSCSNFTGQRYGDPFGKRYCPAHSDAVLREHYWFWDEHMSAPSSTAALLGKYLSSVGRGANMILNIAPNPNGTLPAGDMPAYEALGKAISALYAHPLAVVDTPQLDSSNAVVWTPAAGGAVNISRGGLELMENIVDGQVIAKVCAVLKEGSSDKGTYISHVPSPHSMACGGGMRRALGPTLGSGLSGCRPSATGASMSFQRLSRPRPSACKFLTLTGRLNLPALPSMTGLGPSSTACGVGMLESRLSSDGEST